MHAGENTRFGFGRYAIEEVLDDSSVSSYISLPRSASLLEAAFSPNNLDVVATADELESGPLRAAVSAIERGNYTPDPLFHVSIDKISGGQRLLSIPVVAIGLCNA